MESTHPFSVSFAPCFQAVLCRLQLFFRMFLDRLFQICADRFIMKQKRRCFSPFLLSPSSRRAWIEIPDCRRQAGRAAVALLAEGVDRNSFVGFEPHTVGAVALLAEGVDRNGWSLSRPARSLWSPSSRRAWIEIVSSSFNNAMGTVALLAEGVDRNFGPILSAIGSAVSPSSRRAWIEMSCKTAKSA